MSGKQSLFIRTIAFALVVSFGASEIAHAAPALSPAPLSAAGLKPNRFEAPVDFARLQEIHQGPSDTFIVHIQDAHVNLSGQENLAAALDSIQSKYDAGLVLVEGGSKDDSLTSVKSAASPEIWKRVARTFLIEGKISGEEYLNLTSDRPMKILGVEDKDLYLESVKAYAELAAKREKTLVYLATLRRAVEGLKPKLYPTELLEFEKKNSADESFENRFSRLKAFSAQGNLSFSDWPNLQKLESLQTSEKEIDFDRANLEQAAIADEIRKKGGLKSLEDTLSALSKLKGKKVAQSAYYENLVELAGRHAISLENYPAFAAYGRYLKDFAAIDLDSLVHEMSALEERVYASKLASDDARLLKSIDRYLSLLDTAYRIQMTAEEFSQFKANAPQFPTLDWLAFLNRKLAEEGRFEDFLSYQSELEEGKKALEAFYDSVDRRDQAFLKNAKRILAEENKKTAVLITGGYHTGHLKKLFRDEGYSYAVLTPYVTGETNQAKYEKILFSSVKDDLRDYETRTLEKKTGKKISELEAELRVAQEKSDGVRPLPVVEAAQGARLAELIRAAGGHPEIIDTQLAGEDMAMKARRLLLSAPSIRAVEKWPFSESDLKAMSDWAVNGQTYPDAAISKKWLGQLVAQRGFSSGTGEGRIARKNLDEWRSFLQSKWGLSPQTYESLLLWLVSNNIRLDSIDNETVQDFLKTVIDAYRRYPGLRGPFVYNVPPTASSAEKLSFAAENIRRMTGLFSDNFIDGRTVLKAPIPNSPYYVAMRYGFGGSTHGVSIIIGEERNYPDNPLAGAVFRIGVDTQGDALRVAIMGGVRGKQEKISEEFPREFGFRPSYALLHAALDFAAAYGLEKMIGVREEFIPSMRKGRPSIQITAIYDAFGLTKKMGEFARWQDVAYLKDSRTPKKLAARGQTKNMNRILDAFRRMEKIENTAPVNFDEVDSRGTVASPGARLATNRGEPAQEKAGLRPDSADFNVTAARLAESRAQKILRALEDLRKVLSLEDGEEQELELERMKAWIIDDGWLDDGMKKILVTNSLLQDFELGHIYGLLQAISLKTLEVLPTMTPDGVEVLTTAFEKTLDEYNQVARNGDNPQPLSVPLALLLSVSSIYDEEDVPKSEQLTAAILHLPHRYFYRTVAFQLLSLGLHMQSNFSETDQMDVRMAAPLLTLAFNALKDDSVAPEEKMMLKRGLQVYVNFTFDKVLRESLLPGDWSSPETKAALNIHRKEFVANEKLVTSLLELGFPPLLPFAIYLHDLEELYQNTDYSGLPLDLYLLTQDFYSVGARLSEAYHSESPITLAMEGAPLKDQDEALKVLPARLYAALASSLEADQAAAALSLMSGIEKAYASLGINQLYYHNHTHNLIVASAFLILASRSGLLAAPRDVQTAFLAGLLHDFHLRPPGVPANVDETIRQLRDLLGLEAYPESLRSSRNYRAYASANHELFQKEILGVLGVSNAQDPTFAERWAEIETMIRRTDYAAPDADASRPDEIEAFYAESLQRVASERRDRAHELSLVLERGADRAGVFWLGSSALSEEMANALANEGEPAAAWKNLLFIKAYLMRREVLETLASLSSRYQYNFIETVDRAVELSKKTLADAENRERISDQERRDLESAIRYWDGQRKRLQQGWAAARPFFNDTPARLKNFWLMLPKGFENEKEVLVKIQGADPDEVMRVYRPSALLPAWRIYLDSVMRTFGMSMVFRRFDSFDRAYFGNLHEREVVRGKVRLSKNKSYGWPVWKPDASVIVRTYPKNHNFIEVRLDKTGDRSADAVSDPASPAGGRLAARPLSEKERMTQAAREAISKHLPGWEIDADFAESLAKKIGPLEASKLLIDYLNAGERHYLLVERAAKSLPELLHQIPNTEKKRNFTIALAQKTLVQSKSSLDLTNHPETKEALRQAIRATTELLTGASVVTVPTDDLIAKIKFIIDDLERRNAEGLYLAKRNPSSYTSTQASVITDRIAVFVGLLNSLTKNEVQTDFSLEELLALIPEDRRDDERLLLARYFPTAGSGARLAGQDASADLLKESFSLWTLDVEQNLKSRFRTQKAYSIFDVSDLKLALNTAFEAVRHQQQTSEPWYVGIVALRAELKQSGQLIFTIEDNGTGLDRESVSQLWTDTPLAIELAKYKDAAVTIETNDGQKSWKKHLTVRSKSPVTEPGNKATQGTRFKLSLDVSEDMPKPNSDTLLLESVWSTESSLNNHPAGARLAQPAGARRAVLFPPSGFQMPAVGRDIYEAYPVARQVYDDVTTAARFILRDPRIDVAQFSFAAEQADFSDEKKAVLVHLAIVAHQMALWAVYRNIHPNDAVRIVGMSRGASAAYWAAGAMTLEDAVELAIRNTQFIQSASNLHGGRRMALVTGLNEVTVRNIANSEEGVIAIYYGPDSFVISAPQARLPEIESQVKAKGGVFLRNALTVTSHDPNLILQDSEAAKILVENYQRFLDDLKGRMSDPVIPVHSVLDPQRTLDTKEDILKEEYSVLGQPMLLAPVLERLDYGFGFNDFLTLGAPKDFIVGRLLRANILSPLVSAATVYTAEQMEQFNLASGARLAEEPDLGEAWNEAEQALIRLGEIYSKLIENLRPFNGVAVPFEDKLINGLTATLGMYRHAKKTGKLYRPERIWVRDALEHQWQFLVSFSSPQNIQQLRQWAQRVLLGKVTDQFHPTDRYLAEFILKEDIPDAFYGIILETLESVNQLYLKSVGILLRLSAAAPPERSRIVELEREINAELKISTDLNVNLIRLDQPLSEGFLLVKDQRVFQPFSDDLKSRAANRLVYYVNENVEVEALKQDVRSRAQNLLGPGTGARLASDFQPGAAADLYNRYALQASRVVRVYDELYKRLGERPESEFGFFHPGNLFQIFPMMASLQMPKDTRFIDLGSGDGRVAVAAAIFGAKSVGVELAPEVHAAAVEALRMLEGRQFVQPGRVHLQYDDIFNVPISDMDVIYYYEGSGPGTARIQEKILKEARPGALVVLYGSSLTGGGFPSLEPAKNMDLSAFDATAYRVPAKDRAAARLASGNEEQSGPIARNPQMWEDGDRVKTISGFGKISRVMKTTGGVGELKPHIVLHYDPVPGRAAIDPRVYTLDEARVAVDRGILQYLGRLPVLPLRKVEDDLRLPGFDGRYLDLSVLDEVLTQRLVEKFPSAGILGVYTMGSVRYLGSEDQRIGRSVLATLADDLDFWVVTESGDASLQPVYQQAILYEMEGKGLNISVDVDVIPAPKSGSTSEAIASFLWDDYEALVQGDVQGYLAEVGKPLPIAGGMTDVRMLKQKEAKAYLRLEQVFGDSVRAEQDLKNIAYADHPDKELVEIYERAKTGGRIEALSAAIRSPDAKRRVSDWVERKIGARLAMDDFSHEIAEDLWAVFRSISQPAPVDAQTAWTILFLNLNLFQPRTQVDTDELSALLHELQGGAFKHQFTRQIHALYKFVSGKVTDEDVALLRRHKDSIIGNLFRKISDEIQPLSLEDDYRLPKLGEGSGQYASRYDQSVGSFAVVRNKVDHRQRLRFDAQEDIFRRINPLGERNDLPFLIKINPVTYKAADINDELLIEQRFPEGHPLEYVDFHKWTTRQKLLFSLSLAETMQYLHERSVVHRDLKPLNIWVPKALTDDPNWDAEAIKKFPPMVFDFDISVLFSDSDRYAAIIREDRQERTVLGTAGYTNLTRESYILGDEKDPLILNPNKDLFSFAVVFSRLFDDSIHHYLQGGFREVWGLKLFGRKIKLKTRTARQNEIFRILKTSGMDGNVRALLYGLLRLNIDEITWEWPMVVNHLRHTLEESERAASTAGARLAESGERMISADAEELLLLRSNLNQALMNAPELRGLRFRHRIHFVLKDDPRAKETRITGHHHERTVIRFGKAMFHHTYFITRNPDKRRLKLKDLIERIEGDIRDFEENQEVRLNLIEYAPAPGARLSQPSRLIEEYVQRLRFLSEVGILRGRIFYPVMGNDHFPSLFADTTGVSWQGSEDTVKMKEWMLAAGLQKSLVFDRKPLRVLRSDLFQTNRYFSAILKGGPVDVFYLKGMWTWAQTSFLAQDWQADLTDFVRSSADELLADDGHLILAGKDDEQFVPFVEETLKYEPLRAALETDLEFLVEDSDEFEIGYHGQILVAGKIPFRIYRKPAQSPRSAPKALAGARLALDADKFQYHRWMGEAEQTIDKALASYGLDHTLIKEPLRNAYDALVVRADTDPSFEPLVTLLVSAKPGAIEIEISDNGSGMSFKDLQRLGRPLFTTKEKSIEMFGGDGYGFLEFLDKAILRRRAMVTFETNDGDRSSSVVFNEAKRTSHGYEINIASGRRSERGTSIRVQIPVRDIMNSEPLLNLKWRPGVGKPLPRTDQTFQRFYGARLPDGQARLATEKSSQPDILSGARLADNRFSSLEDLMNELDAQFSHYRKILADPALHQIAQLESVIVRVNNHPNAENNDEGNIEFIFKELPKLAVFDILEAVDILPNGYYELIVGRNGASAVIEINRHPSGEPHFDEIYSQFLKQLTEKPLKHPDYLINAREDVVVFLHNTGKLINSVSIKHLKSPDSSPILLITTYQHDPHEDDEPTALHQIFVSATGVKYKEPRLKAVFSSSKFTYRPLKSIEWVENKIRLTVDPETQSIFEKIIFPGIEKLIEVVPTNYDVPDSLIKDISGARLAQNEGRTETWPAIEGKDTYGGEMYVSRGFTVHDTIYGITEELNKPENRGRPLSVLLIGVGQGFTSTELQLLYPNLEIHAVNRGKGLWNPDRVAYVLKNVYSEAADRESILAAANKIKLHILDIENADERKAALGNKRFDLVIFESSVEDYLKDTLRVVEDLYNERVAVKGFYGFEYSNVLTTDRGQRLRDERFLEGYFPKGAEVLHRYHSNFAQTFYSLRKRTDEQFRFGLRLAETHAIKVSIIEPLKRIKYYEPENAERVDGGVPDSAEGARLATEKSSQPYMLSGGRLADGTRAEKSFLKTYGARLATQSLAKSQDADEDSLFLLARFFVGLGEVKALAKRQHPFQFKNGKALFDFVKEGGEVKVRLYHADYKNEKGEFYPLEPAVVLDEALLARAREANRADRTTYRTSSLEDTLASSMSPRDGVRPLQAQPELEALAEHGRLDRLAASTINANALTEAKPVVFRLFVNAGPAFETELELARAAKVKLQHLLKLGGREGLARFVISREDGQEIESDTLPEGDFVTIYVATPTSTILSRAMSQQAGFIALPAKAAVNEVNSVPYFATFTAAFMVATSPDVKNDEALDRLLKSLIWPDKFIDTADRRRAYQAMRRVAILDVAYYLGLVVRPMKLNIDLFLKYAALRLQAVGTAA